MKEAKGRQPHGLLVLAGFCQRLAARRSLLAALSVVATLGLFGGVRQAHAQCNPVANGLTCMDDVTSCSLNCTANDVTLAVYNISGTCSVGGAPCIVNNSPACTGTCVPDLINCTPGEPVTVSLQAQLVAGANERWDIGIYLALDGGDALTGSCLRTFLNVIPLEPGTTQGTCSGDASIMCTNDAACGANAPCDLCSPSCTNGGACFKDADCPVGEQCLTGYDPDSGGGPFFDGECTEDPDDLCGDLQQGVDTFLNLGLVTFICADSDGDGKADIGTCTSWDNARSDGGNKPSCMNQDDTLPNTPAKCRCEPIAIGCVCLECQACDTNLDCQPVTDGEGCMDTDNNACTTPGCESGICVQDHIVVNCTNMLDECNNATCDPATGLCTVPDPKPLSTECGAGDLCAPEHCDGAGNCVANGPPVNCNDNDRCTDDSCDSATGMCVNTPNSVCACGNNIVDPGEDCDGTADDACGEDEECNEFCRCEPIVPTVSGWGLIALVLLLQVGMAIKFGQYRPQVR